MKNKLMMFVLLGMILLSVSSVSALELNPFANVKTYETTPSEDLSDFIKEDFNENYGAITFSKTIFWISTDKLAEYSLINNTESCLINCESRGKVVLHQDGKIFDDLRFVDKLGRENQLSNARYYYKTFENYEIEVPDTYKEVCVENPSNSTSINETSCYQEVETYKNETRTNEVWVEYKGETLQAGDYEWKITGTKKPTQTIDFIPFAQGKTLDEWAWWDGDWEFKREIKVKENSGSNLSNYTTLIYVPYDSDMKTDFSDLRFTNSTENGELSYWIENKTDSSFAYVWVKVPNLTASINNTIYMYYGNSGASSKSNGDVAFLLFDDFTGTSLNTTKWGIWASGGTTGANVSVGSGYVTINLNDGFDGYGIYSLNNFSAPIELRYSYQAVTGEHAGGFQSSVPADRVTNKGGFITGGETTWYNQLTNGTIFSIGTRNTDWQKAIFRAYGTTSYLSVQPFGSVTSHSVSGIDGQAIRVWLSAQHTSSSHRYDNVLVRNYASSEPTYTIGSEETSEGMTIAFVTPPTLENYANITQEYIPIKVNVTYTSSSFINITYSLRDINGTNYTQFYENETYSINFTDLPDAHYHYNVTACGEGTSTAIYCVTTETRHLNHDTTPPTLELFSPLTNYTTLTLPINVTLNFSASDESLGSCWYNLDSGTNTTFTCNTTRTINVTTSGAHSINYYANDTLGNLATGTAPFYVYYITRNATATNPITEGGLSSHSFYLNMTDITNFNATAELYWNGTSYGLGTKTTLSDDSLRFDKNLIVPSINGTSVNWTWVYNISGNPNVTNYNLTGSQTYIKVNITECGAGTYQILNYTLYDQETRALGSTANASIEVDLTLTSQANDSLSWQYHATKTSATSFLICLPSGALNNSAYNLDSTSKYSYQDHVIQYHYIENFNLTNSSIPQTIRLYPLATAKSTSFLVNYQDENYIYVENAVIDVWRRYIGDGVFFSVEHGKTDASGQTRLHLVTEDIIYKFLVWQDGELVYTSPEYLALCQATPCQINLRQSTEETDGLSERDNLVYDYDFNKTTRTASFIFATKDNTQTEINMTILSSNQYANETACTTTLTTSGGQIDCVIPTAFTNTSYQTIIYQDGEYFGTAFDSLAPNSMEIFGYTGLILTAISYLMLALMGISSGIATIVFGIIGLVFMGLIQIFESGSVLGMTSAILWLIVAGIIIIIKITKRRIQ